VTASLAYRKNESAILRGDVPEKYTRLLPYIPGERILEIVSAEGVLALLLAKAGKDVAALEKSPERHEAAISLADSWGIRSVRFFRGDIAENLFLLNEADTLVAVRMIYYLGDQLDTVFSQVARKVPNVVLCGNGNRAGRWRQGIREETKADNYYASREGMVDLLTRHGYRIETVVPEGDEIVVGRKDA
jgi:SAM-dependent methyltransferase